MGEDEARVVKLDIRGLYVLASAKSHGPLGA